jgi:hypothetical protein
MPKLPVVSGAETVRAFERAGWYVDRQRGSHVVCSEPGLSQAFPCRSTGRWLPAHCGLCFERRE